MLQPGSSICTPSPAPSRAGIAVFAACGMLALALSVTGRAQDATAQQKPASQPAEQPAAQQAPAAETPQAAPAPTETPTALAESAAATAPAEPVKAAPAQTAEAGSITEEELRRLLVGKELFLRGGYLDNTLSFNEHGMIIGHSPQGSYTLAGIAIDKVHLSKHKVELEGRRYGLHFLGAMPYEDPTKAVDRVNITPKKKEVRITVDRELVVKAKEAKEKGGLFKPLGRTATKPEPAATGTATANAEAAAQTADASDARDAQKEITAAPAAERPADPNSVTTTTSPAHANKLLLDALNNVFAQPFDERMMASMPGFWRLYYEAAAAKTDYRPKDPTVMRQNMVDQKARLTTTFEPASNQFAQDNGVAGMSLYHVVIGADGKPGEIAVARPIGFGLDESAVDSIRKASFSPAMKDGKPVPVLLDLVVEFRIYSKRTAAAGTPETAEEKSEPALPGPYSIQHN